MKIRKLFENLLLGALFSTLAVCAQATATSYKYGSDKGSLNVEVPIAVPKGTAGLAPVLSFSYKHGQNEAFMGEGWALTGFSSINRCPSIRFLKKKVVGLIESDDFCIDGKRLIKISEKDALGRVEYRTEFESFSRFVAFYKDGSGYTDTNGIWRNRHQIVGWREWKREGLVVDYGVPNAITYSPDFARARRTDSGDGVSALIWLQSRVLDTYRNAIDISYSARSSSFDVGSESNWIFDNVYAAKPVLVEYGGQYAEYTNEGGGEEAQIAPHHSRVRILYAVNPKNMDGAALSLAPGGGVAPMPKYLPSVPKYGEHSATRIYRHGYLDKVVTETVAFQENTNNFVAAKEYKVWYQAFSGSAADQYRHAVAGVQECVPNAAQVVSWIPACYALVMAEEQKPTYLRPVQFGYASNGLRFTNANYQPISDREVNARPTTAPSGKVWMSMRYTHPGGGENTAAGLGTSQYIDINGDGITDFCWHRNDGYTSMADQNKFQCRLGVRSYQGGENHGFSDTVIVTVLPPYFRPWYNTQESQNQNPNNCCMQAFYGMFDVNGDGRPDACFIMESKQIRCLKNQRAADGSPYFSEILDPTPAVVQGQNVRGVSWAQWNNPADLSGQFGWNLQTPWRDKDRQRGSPWVGAGDIDGDGRSDFCMLNRTGWDSGPNAVQCFVRYGPGAAEIVLVSAVIPVAAAEQIRLMDMNHDGLLDLCYVTVGKTFVCHYFKDAGSDAGANRYSFGPPTTFAISTWDTEVILEALISGYVRPGAAQKEHIGGYWVDFNGDGFPDLCTVKNENGLVCFLTAGRNRFEEQVAINLEAMESERYFVDLNGDGRTDFCFFAKNTNSSQMKCYVNSGQMYSVASAPPALISHYFSDGGEDNAGLGMTGGFVSVNGDTRPSFCRISRTTQHRIICTGFESDSGGQLIQITNQDKTARIYYRNLAAYVGYTPGFFTSNETVQLSSTPFKPTRISTKAVIASCHAPENGRYCRSYIPMTPTMSAVAMIEENRQGHYPHAKHFEYRDFTMDASTGTGDMGFGLVREFSELGNATPGAETQRRYQRTDTFYALTYPHFGTSYRKDVYVPGANSSSPDTLVSTTDTDLQTQMTKGYDISSCGVYLGDKAPWPVPIVVFPGAMVEKNWTLTTQGGIVRGAVPVGGKVIEPSDFDLCGKPKKLVETVLDANFSVSGFSTTTAAVFTNTFGSGTTSSAKWLIGRTARISVTSTSPVPVVPVAAAMPSAGGLLPEEAPPPYTPGVPLNPSVLSAVLLLLFQ